MEVSGKTLYNLLRTNWLLDPSLLVERWQVEDYRLWTIEKLFNSLQRLDIQLDKESFVTYSENCETPEELADCLVEEGADAQAHDQIYLLVFELWRRLVPEKQSQTIFCDELDYQINVYDEGTIDNSECIQDILANLQKILDENVDEGIDSNEAFDSIAETCANDLESFLYDFISNQIDIDNNIYATDLLEGFYSYIKDVKWFDFLYARLAAGTDIENANRIIKGIFEENSEHPVLELNLEMLLCLAQKGDRKLFSDILKQSVKLLEIEEDFQYLLQICGKYFLGLDYEQQEQVVGKILQKRSQYPREQTINLSDPDIQNLVHTVNASHE